MKKIIILGDAMLNDLVKAICHKHKVFHFFPKNEHQFNYVREYFAMAITGTHPPIGQKEKELKIGEMLTDFLGDTKDEDILYISAYEVPLRKDGLTAIDFYEKFLGGDKACIVLTKTTDGTHLNQVLHFIGTTGNRRQITRKMKTGDFQKKLDAEMSSLLTP